ncbi:TetR/AcrR family transcriptional regulator [Pseudonocardia acaciae]|uniref:TetR/AcrR family transcriptional regulator n=1 Tax=Pseudonocardia acaciae TaxID=551276 RepID=UPI00048E052A|nr:TetR/AcrR family transcriptional regulator [Pseudonocardia acaciae]
MSAVTAGRGRIDKRLAILDAAFAVFAREGYAQASVDVIAAEAGVAKATVYSHFQDKENLLLRAVEAQAERALARNLAVVDRLAEPGRELAALLEEVGYRLLECYVEARSLALWRLLASEVVQFPTLFEIVQVGVADRVADALADRFARLAVAGRLDLDDPVLAAEQFVSLLIGSMAGRTRLGSREVGAEELRAVTQAAVRTFLKAFGPG